jgi:hypothetical protein
MKEKRLTYPVMVILPGPKADNRFTLATTNDFNEGCWMIPEQHGNAKIRSQIVRFQ